METALLRTESLSASYGEYRAIESVSLELHAGEILCIAGESGSGKSTLIKAVHGMSGLVIDEGSVYFEGRDITRIPYSERRRIMGADIGLIPQDPAASFNPLRRFDAQLKEALDAHDMIYDEAGIIRILEDIGIKDAASVLKQRPFELSGGMNQRMAIAAAMMFEPKLLLCDEAASALDVTTAGAVVRELMDIRQTRGTAILMVTHHLGIAKMMADYLGIMKDGQIVEYGRASKIFDEPENEYTRALLRDVPRLKS